MEFVGGFLDATLFPVSSSTFIPNHGAQCLPLFSKTLGKNTPKINMEPPKVIHGLFIGFFVSPFSFKMGWVCLEVPVQPIGWFSGGVFCKNPSVIFRVFSLRSLLGLILGFISSVRSVHQGAESSRSLPDILAGTWRTERFQIVVSNVFYFHPYLGKIYNLTNIFQMG